MLLFQSLPPAGEGFIAFKGSFLYSVPKPKGQFFFPLFCLLDAPTSSHHPQEQTSPPSPRCKDPDLIGWLLLHGADQESVDRVSFNLWAPILGNKRGAQHVSAETNPHLLAFCVHLDTEWRVHFERYPQRRNERRSEEFKTEVSAFVFPCLHAVHGG